MRHSGATDIKPTGLGFVSSLANDDVGRILLLAGEVVLEDRLRTVGVASLGIEGGTGIVGHHTVSTAQRVLHRPPRVVLGCGLDVPHITTVASEVAALDRLSDCLTITNRTTSSVDEPSTLNRPLSKTDLSDGTKSSIPS